MTRILTAAQMRNHENAAMDAGIARGIELMERAGAGVLAEALARFPKLASAPGEALILCGPGNNGGDGFVIARHLAECGWTVTVVLYGDPARLPPDAAEMHKRFVASHPVVAFADWDPAVLSFEAAERPALIVDALFGGGLARPLPDDLTQPLRLLDQCFPQGGAVRVAVDAPSGLCLDSGRPLLAEGASALPLRQDLTVTFHAFRPGHFLGEGPEWCGQVAVVDIGLPPCDPTPSLQLTEANHLNHDKGRAALRRSGAHKYDFGHALVLAGSSGHGGAARLAAGAALRAGAGLVTLGCPAEALVENAARLDAVMLRVIDTAGELARQLEDQRINALCLGPGLGLGRARDLVPEALASRRPCILDADALTAFWDAPDVLFALLHRDAILTPHAGEFARLFPDLADKLNRRAESGPATSALDVTRAAAARCGAAVLLKGPATVIATPEGDAWINAAVYGRSAPWLATAGAGDVLAGIITGYTASNPGSIAHAAADAAWLHVEAARRFGPGLVAEDLPGLLPAVMADLMRDSAPSASS